ncbi:hypothetical protein D021_2986A, partial [Vibrio parahaemolyticus 10296]|jgi:beta-glucosidase
MLL